MSLSADAVMRPRASPARDLLGEVAKLPAFLRRDILVAWSYRDVLLRGLRDSRRRWSCSLRRQARAEPTPLPSFGGTQTTYVEFVTLGIVINLVRAGGSDPHGRRRIRQEQMIGTLEALLVTPTATATVQLGSAVFDLVYMPLRTAIFLGFMVALRGRRPRASGILPSAAILLAFIPFVWGLGLATARPRSSPSAAASGAMVLGVTPARPRLGRLLPALAAAGLDRRRWRSTTRSRSPSRACARRCSAARAGAGVGEDIALLVPLSDARPAGRHARVQARARPRAAPRHSGAVLMSDIESAPDRAARTR